MVDSGAGGVFTLHVMYVSARLSLEVQTLGLLKTNFQTATGKSCFQQDQHQRKLTTKGVCGGNEITAPKLAKYGADVGHGGF